MFEDFRVDAGLANDFVTVNSIRGNDLTLTILVTRPVSLLLQRDQSEERVLDGSEENGQSRSSSESMSHAGIGTLAGHQMVIAPTAVSRMRLLNSSRKCLLLIAFVPMRTLRLASGCGNESEGYLQ